VLGHLVLADDGTELETNLGDTAQRPAGAANPVVDFGKVTLGCGEQILTLAPARASKLGVAADDQALAGIVISGDAGKIAVIEQRELEDPRIDQGADLRGAQRGDPVEPGADLFYANADRFADEALALIDGAPAPVRRFVVDASAMTDIDYSAARTLRDFIAELAARKVHIVFGRVSPSPRADMQRYNTAATLGEEHIFSTLHEALAEARSDEASLWPL
jgi:hypothetical protein